MSALSERLLQAKGGRSIDDIVEAAAKGGHSIDRSGVARYLQPTHPRPRTATIEALAAGFGLDPREVRELAGRPRGELGPWIPPAESASLPQEVRDALDQLIRAMVSSSPSATGPQADPGPAQDGPARGSVAPIRRRKPPAVPPVETLAADAQDGPTVQQADEDLNRQNEAGEDNQDGPDEPV